MKTIPYNLDKIDCKLLYELDKNCRSSDTLLAKRIGRSREATRYRIKELMKAGVLEKFITSINHGKLGITYYKIFLQLENIPSERERLFEYIESHKKVPWYGLCSGVWDMIIGVSARSNLEFDEIKNEIFSRYKHLIIRKEIGVMVETKQFVKRFLYGPRIGEKTFAGEMGNIELDPVDQQILDLLASDARIPLTRLSAKVGVPLRSVMRRVKRLEEGGVIIAYRTLVNLNLIGMEFFKVILYYRSVSKREERRLLEYIGGLPQALYYIKMIARWDVELEVAVRSYHELNLLIDGLRREFPDIIRNHEVVMINRENWLAGLS